MRVLMVHPHLSPAGGSLRVVKNLSQCLGERGIESSLMTLTPFKGMEEDFAGSSLYFPASCGYSALSGANCVSESMRLLREIKCLGAMLRRHADDFDLINIYGFPSTWAVHGIKKPVVWMFNEPGDIRGNLRRFSLLRGVYGLGVRMDKFIINNYVDTICVGDESNRDRVIRRYGREPRLIPYGMDMGDLPSKKNSDFRQKLGIEGRFVVVQPGMVSPQKNQLESIKAIERLRQRIHDIVLVIAGLSQGGYRKRLDEYIRRNGLERHVIFTGHVRDKDVRSLYSASDVALFPERSDSGWLYPLEVISSGATLVVSEAFDASRLIARERLGLVTNDLASAIEYVFKNPSKSRRAAERAFKWVRGNFGWENYTGKMVEVFESVVA